MPRIITTRTKPAPEGYDDISQVLDDYQRKMRDAESNDNEGKRKNEANWPIYQIDHMRSKYIYDLYYTRESISKELYDWLLKQGQANALLIAKWKKNGYESLCCVRCIQSRDMNNPGSTCICRVPSKSLDGNASVNPCSNCGCRGCSSSDQASAPKENNKTITEEVQGKYIQDQLTPAEEVDEDAQD